MQFLVSEVQRSQTCQTISAHDRYSSEYRIGWFQISIHSIRYAILSIRSTTVSVHATLELEVHK